MTVHPTIYPSQTNSFINTAMMHRYVVTLLEQFENWNFYSKVNFCRMMPIS